jgi:hypothetical protein
MCLIEWIKNNEAIITLFFSFLVAISTVVYAILTRKMVKKTILTRRLQTDPKIIMDIISYDDHPYLFNMIIANIGNSPAVNIKFNILNEPDIKKSKKLSEYIFIKNGIDFFVPGK